MASNTSGSGRRNGRADPHGRGESGSEARFVFSQRLLQTVEHGLGIVARLARVVGPLSLDRGNRLVPCSHLVRRQLVDLVARDGELGVPGELELGPWSGHFL